MRKLFVLLLLLCIILSGCGSEEVIESPDSFNESLSVAESTSIVTPTNPPTEIPAEISTQTPTETPTTPPIESTEEQDGYVKVNEIVYTTTDVNVRTGPGTEFDKVGRIPKNEAITRIGIGNDGWSKVIYEGEVCFMSSKYLTTVTPSTETSKEKDDGYSSVNEIVYTTTDVNVRSGPGTNYDKIGRIPQGQSVNRIGIGNDGWSKIIYEGNTCYISSKYLSSSKPSETAKEESKTEMVWIPQSGSKYHSKSNCSKMKNPSQVSKETAIARGYTACSKCY